MARKNIFDMPSASTATSDEPVRSTVASTRPLLGLERLPKRNSPVGAISESLGSISAKVKHAEEIEQKLAEGQAIVDLDPDVIDDSFVVDRMEVSEEDQAKLVELIREHGQQVPILVRPHPEIPERYQIAYGRRRLRASRSLGAKVRAVVKTLTDEQLVVAQGQENTGRTDLTFIERARFAARLEERKFSRETIMAALSVEKANLSRMISIASRIPPDIIETIGSAPGFGRQRWQDLADLLDRKTAIEAVRALIQKQVFAATPSDQRFERVFNAVRTKAPRARAEPWVADDGTRLGRITQTAKRYTVVIDERVAPDFGSFVRDRLQSLYEEFKRRSKDE